MQKRIQRGAVRHMAKGVTTRVQARRRLVLRRVV
jgi:hypothetical protein